MLTKCQTEETITAVLLEGRGERLGEFDVLILDGKATNSNVISTDDARRRRTIAVADLPGATTDRLVGAGIAGVVDGVSLRSGSLSGLWEISRPNLGIVSFLSQGRARLNFY